MTTMVDSTQLDGSWADDLPPAMPVDGMVDTELVTEPVSNDETKILNAPANACPVCGEEIVRVPGTRGRLPKMHPECREATKSVGKRVPTPRIPRVSKADAEKEAQISLALDRLGSKLNQAIVLLSLVDVYDALVIKVNAPEILSNLRALLWRYDRFRAIAVGIDTGGSIFGLVVALLTTVLPIMAHHNLIPSKKVSQILLQAPMILMRVHAMAERSENGDFTQELLERAMHQAQQQQRARSQKMDEHNGRDDSETDS